MKCPCCEQDLVERPDLLFSETWRAIIRYGICVELSPLQFNIINAVRRRARTNTDLIELLYSDRSDGGPDTAKNVIHVTIHAMNRKLSKILLKVGSDRVGPHAPLRLIDLAKIQCAQS